VVEGEFLADFLQRPHFVVLFEYEVDEGGGGFSLVLSESLGSEEYVAVEADDAGGFFSVGEVGYVELAG